ncbi:MAG TPA: hypothetical protein PLZ78_08975 [Spirochaetota bacterium]|nr:hypothetical protein [Spirochaetota bacterium]
MKKEDLTNQVFGRLTALSYSHTRLKRRYFKVVCECGNVLTVNVADLKSGNTQSCGCLRLERIKLIAGEKHPNWKGDKVGYFALHGWVKRKLEKPSVCSVCGIKASRMEIHNKSGKYKRDLSDWQWLCAGCHRNLRNIRNPKTGQFMKGESK